MRRKYRLPDGATRDGKTQLGIRNFTFKSGDKNFLANTKVNGGGLPGVAGNRWRSNGSEAKVTGITDTRVVQLDQNFDV